MRIDRLTLTNFRNFTTLDLDFTDPRTLIVGPNGAGKSTIFDAIAWVLLGECRGVDGRGSGQQGLIRDGAKEASATLDFDGIQITRQIDATGARATAKVDVILERLGVTKATLKAVLDSQAFFDLDHKAAKDLLFGLLDVVVKPDDLPTLNLKAPISLDDLDLRYKSAFDRRAVAKKALASTAIPEPPKVANLADGAIGDLPDIERARRAARQKASDTRDAWLQGKARRDEVARAVDHVVEAMKNAQDLDAKIEAQEGMLADVDKARAAIAQPTLPDDARSLGDLQQEAVGIQGLIGRLKGHDPAAGCVLNPSIPCHTAAKEFQGHVAAADKRLKALQKDMKAAGEVTKAQAAYEAAIRENDRQRQYHQGQVDALKSKRESAKTDRGRLAKLEADLATVTADLPTLEAAAGDAMKADGAAESRFVAASGYAQAMKAFDQQVAQRAKLEQEVADLEALVDLLGPKGVRATVLARSLGDFQDTINAALAAFGFTLTFQVDPWLVLVNARPYGLLSAGEKLMVGASFQQALAMVSGLEFVAIDASEVVVGDLRAALTELVMTSPVGQILIAMAKGPMETVPDMDGLQVVMPHLMTDLVQR